jgi:hypothetical protein
MKDGKVLGNLRRHLGLPREGIDQQHIHSVFMKIPHHTKEPEKIGNNQSAMALARFPYRGA